MHLGSLILILCSLQDNGLIGEPLYYLYAHCRVRRFHTQVTHAVVSCEFGLDGIDGVLRLKEAPCGEVWDYISLWSVAKRVLNLGPAAARVVILAHQNLNYHRVAELPGDAPYTFDVWPEVFKQVPVPVPPRLVIPGEETTTTTRPRPKASGGVKVVRPDRIALSPIDGVAAPRRPPEPDDVIDEYRPDDIDSEGAADLVGEASSKAIELLLAMPWVLHCSRRTLQRGNPLSTLLVSVDGSVSGAAPTITLPEDVACKTFGI